jgi:hypothetical protein
LNRGAVLPAPIRVSGAHPLSLAERKKWALRQGAPLWLWPEVDRRQWQLALEAIAQTCRAILRGEAAAPLDYPLRTPLLASLFAFDCVVMALGGRTKTAA